ncbi:class I SAM-dependent methyltransferase [Algoriphagus aquimarinus]|uniref:class I SAM-dependent methyltransferase n=1 Tax=Algoriphagus aquimarinus TaxID=237018 RepID=UPI0030DAC119|tara:strand:- start:1364 stop:2200 length:837 start_codon:yes stop_codon:yes gene_type:complete
MDKLEFTGERLIPGVYGQIAIDHLHRYSIAYPLVANKVVLDIACGEGYGSSLLSKVADQVIGVDISETTVNHAKQRYNSNNLSFRVGSADKIPVEDNFFDIVVSFETIEHLENHDEMISEIKRVLKHNGLLIISSPNKVEYSVARNYSNPFHEKELNKGEFEELISKYFDNVIVKCQSPLIGSFVYDDKVRSEMKVNIVSGDFSAFDFNFYVNPKYFIIFAGNLSISNLNSIFVGNELFNYEFNKIKNYREKFINSFRYKLINFLFIPFDFFKSIIRK